jgi:hypothetical protein
MQLHHIVMTIAAILALGMAYAFYLFVVYAVTSNHARHFGEGHAAGLHQARFENSALTTADLEMLLAITNTLRLAHSTWLPMVGTEPHQARVVAQLTALNKIAIRIRDHVEPDQVMLPSVAHQALGEAA